MKLKYAIIAFTLFVIIGVASFIYMHQRKAASCIDYYDQSDSHVLYRDCK